MSVIPTADELLAPARPLRAAITDKPYPNAAIYRRTNHDLYREDMIFGLRETIRHYRERGYIADDRMREEAYAKFPAKVYEEVRMVNVRSRKGKGPICRLALDANKLKIEVDEEKRKGLVHGSLICLSDDDFESFVLAKVYQCYSIKSGGQSRLMLNVGVVCKHPEETTELTMKFDYTLIEGAYFKAYEKVLHFFKTTTKIPFSQQIVHCCSSTIRKPEYLRGARFNFGPLVKDKYKRQYDRDIWISSTLEWPSAEALGLHDDQMACLQHIFTNKFALIQGPPGTGKSFLGALIVNILVELGRQAGRGKRPIFIVCYTNHAVDSILATLIEKYGINVRRIGGRCRHPLVGPKVVNIKKDFYHLMTADVIGLTTTGMAVHRERLQRISSDVMIIEEAAEVCEQHLVASILPGIQHLILIGDHLQLKPSPDADHLKSKGMDVSLFERMINNEIPYRCLETQHRMCPEVSVSLRHIYPNLRDAPSVLLYKDIRKKKVLFQDHNHAEKFVKTSHGFCNEFEVEWVVNLAGFLLDKGYSRPQITVITGYKLQKEMIERRLQIGRTKALKKEIVTRDPDDGTITVTELEEKIEVRTVDSFQGEENEIIILSMVRSERPGFMAAKNRICVALSRAKQGLFAVGNFETLFKRKSALWMKIIEERKARGEYRM